MAASVPKPRAGTEEPRAKPSTVIAEEEMRTVSSFTPSCWLVSVIVVMSKMAGFHSYTHLLQGTNPERQKENKPRWEEDNQPD